MRRERRVRPGFTPAEDIARFRSPRVAAKMREQGLTPESPLRRSAPTPRAEAPKTSRADASSSWAHDRVSQDKSSHAEHRTSKATRANDTKQYNPKPKHTPKRGIDTDTKAHARPSTKPEAKPKAKPEAKPETKRDSGSMHTHRDNDKQPESADDLASRFSSLSV